jgi:hypothetical protein
MNTETWEFIDCTANVDVFSGLAGVAPRMVNVPFIAQGNMSPQGMFHIETLKPK